MEYKRFIKKLLCHKKIDKEFQKNTKDPLILKQLSLIRKNKKYSFLNDFYCLLPFNYSHISHTPPIKNIRENLRVLKEKGVHVSSRMYDSYQNFKKSKFQGYFTKSNDIISIKGFPEYYQLRLDFFTGIIDPQKIIKIGKKEYHKCKHEISALEKKGVKVLYHTFKNKKEVILFIRKFLRDIIKRCSNDFTFDTHIRFPRIQINTKLNENESKAYFMYNSPTCKYPYGKGKGKVVINLNSLVHVDISDLCVLILHEILPGHFYQHYYYPTPFLKPSHVFTEGWALYIEKYIDQFGDSYKLARLRNRLLRSVRCMIDPYIHYKHIGYKKACKIYSTLLPFLSKKEVKYDIRRYMSNPGQACSYLIGCHKIESLLKKFKGSRKKFHNTLLKKGAGVFYLSMS